jgi:O-methyltransferase
MKIGKLIAPDYLPGKILVLIRLLIDTFILILQRPYKQGFKLAQLIWKVKPRYTMVTNKNLVCLFDLVQQINRSNIPGDVIECGVWNGGSSAVMASSHYMSSSQPKRTFWLFDSFSGLPEPSEKDGILAKELYFKGLNNGKINKVKEILRKLNLPETSFQILPGWFCDTLPNAPIDQIALLHVDADWYDSVKLVLETFYDRVAQNGVIVFDDYGYWEGCRRAVDEFVSARKIGHQNIHPISKTGLYIRKSAIDAPVKCEL